MKKALCILAATAMVVGVQAKEENSWKGAYVGASFGGLMGTATATEYYGPWDYGEYSMTEAGLTAGILAGYNWMVNPTGLLGIDADINGALFNPERTFGSSYGNYKNETEWNWFSTVRIRGGIVLDKTLLFVAAGAAIVDVDYSFGNTAGTMVSKSTVSVGYTAGAGIELAVSEHSNIRFEYLYIGLPSEELSDFDGETGDFVSSANIARFAYIYKF